ncbi:5-formyltetrahydrofolate cyclo-ligase [Christiangramia forsetii]|uniref:5-formyltetrahydrofolate cyclo-ligase n=2 Tax=Christiangramia forsetii TaxID=411153 RepID=A0M676_CHRFK|nr:5-formyltetrahydrofolate cyclo-ligase [Christiangramia forsetii]GGG31196.1 5-formyltetrahydrofolate cyclo-ligase [Christiangramia forsetii]CAL68121.1 5-formyltetrahydrofolate cyclo-ligase [Christiangramia forsetii KT0803]
MNKDDLRKKYKEHRLQLDDAEIEKLSLEIANKALELPVWDYRYYHIFLSIAEQKEVSTEYLLHILQGKDKEVIIPRSNAETGELTNILLTDQTVIKKNRWNIPEPQDGIEIKSEMLDVVFIPLLAFDKQGHRVGYGKGFYDRFLASCKPDIVKIGLSFFEPVEEIKEIFSSDIPLNYCVTPDKVYKLNLK